MRKRSDRCCACAVWSATPPAITLRPFTAASSWSADECPRPRGLLSRQPRRDGAVRPSSPRDFRSAMNTIPFVDLLTVHRDLRDEFRSMFEAALDTAGFIGGPVVRDFEAGFAELCRRGFCVGM